MYSNEGCGAHLAMTLCSTSMVAGGLLSNFLGELLGGLQPNCAECKADLDPLLAVPFSHFAIVLAELGACQGLEQMQQPQHHSSVWSVATQTL